MRLAVQLGLVLILNKRSTRATQHFEFKHPFRSFQSSALTWGDGRGALSGPVCSNNA